MQEIINQLSETIRASAASKATLRIHGGGTKDFYGGTLSGETLAVSASRGIVDYEPTELVITARAGTPLAEIEAKLRECGQMLAFEPPYFGPAATLGGCIAAGLSGPRRAYAGAVRDFVLGVRMLDGTGNDLRFGGQVMKNVAGFDVSRLMVGSLGTLGVILEVSLKVLPLPVAEATLRFETTAAEAIAKVNIWAGQPLSVSATVWHAGNLSVRLSGAAAAIEAAVKKLGGERLTAAQAEHYWQSIRDHTAPYFKTSQPLWRLSLKSTTPMVDLGGDSMIEGGGALRWLATDADAHTIRAIAVENGGHATLFRGGNKSVGVFQPLSPALMEIHRNLKNTFDPAGILNPGRFYWQ